MNDHVGAERNWLLKKGRHESVVHDQFDFLAAANLCNGGNVAERHQRVGRGFDVDHASALAKRSLHVLRVGGVYISEFQAVSGKHLVEKARNTAIKIVPADNMVSGLEHGTERVDGRHATGEDARGDSAFKRSEIFFQAVAGRIGDAGIFVSFVLAELFLNIGGSG